MYKLLSVPMTDFNCGELCAPKNDGSPFCCDKELTVPLLFKEEYLLHKKRSEFWKRLPRRTRKQKQLAAEFDSNHDFACVCPGPETCDRDRRALVCRTYPFEPYIDGEDRFVGLAFILDGEHPCPLIEHPELHVNSEYVENSMAYWELVFALYPEERDVFVEESAKRRERDGDETPFFRPNGG